MGGVFIFLFVEVKILHFLYANWTWTDGIVWSIHPTRARIKYIKAGRHSVISCTDPDTKK